MGNLRQIKYNMETDTGDQISLRHRWTFFILNEQTEINRIAQRIRNTLAPCDEEDILCEARIPSSDRLRYKAFAISSDKGNFKPGDKGRIYHRPKKFRQDRALTPDKDEIWFDETYLPRILKQYQNL